MSNQSVPPPPPPPGKKYAVPDHKNLYFSYWSWEMLKNCPHKFFLNVIEQVERPKGRDMGTAIQGSIPHAQSEDFFKLDIPKRDMNFFLDTFDGYWTKFVKENFIDWQLHGARFIKYAINKGGSLATVQFWAKEHGIIMPPHGNPFKDNTVEEIYAKIGPAKKDQLEKLGYDTKRAETFEHTKNLMRLITTLELHKKTVHTELPFRVVIEPARTESTGAYSPSLTVGGRIDLVVDLENGTSEVWDVKGVKNPKDLDLDQLIIYRMGMKAIGKTVSRVGYLDVKHCEVLVHKILDSHEYQLRKNMRFASQFFKVNQWPANYTEWKCRYCDVKSMCKEYQSRQARDQELLKLTPGKVQF